jgi:hypothetical protein
MPGMTDYSATNWIAYITGKTSMPATPTAYVGLFTTAPTSDSGVTGATEVSGGSYARQSTSGSTWNTPSNSSGSEPAVTPANTTNATSITFPTATANWGTVTSFALFDALTSGNCLLWDYLGNFSWLPATCTSASPGVITAHAHGYSNGDNVIITAKYGGTIPSFSQSNFTGLLVVANVTTDTFTVTNGGTAVNTSSTGDFDVRKVSTQTVNSGTQISFTGGTPGNLTITAA